MTKREIRCKACGTLNHMPGYSIERVAQCIQCHAVLPEPGVITLLRGLYAVRFPTVAIAFTVLLAWTIWEPLVAWIPNQRSTFWFNDPTAKPGYLPRRETTAQPPPRVDFGQNDPVYEPSQQLSTKQPSADYACVKRKTPRHGLYKQYDFSDQPARLTIETAPGANYFVNLEEVATNATALLFFVYGGQTLDVRVPLGDFKIKYAAGSDWCGPTNLFGADTTFSEAEDIFLFRRSLTRDGYTTTHWTVELILQPGGNLRTKTIPKEGFFGGDRKKR